MINTPHNDDDAAQRYALTRRGQRLLLTAVTLALVAAKAQAADIRMPSAVLSPDKVIQRIAFGSCTRPQLDMDIFNRIAATRPDVFLYMGDNVYQARERHGSDLKELRKAYTLLAESESFEALRTTTPVIVTWDDHDYGFNDAGGDWPQKEASLALFREAWDIKESDPRRSRDGVYHARIVGPPGRRVQFITLDTRYFRSPLKRGPRNETGRYDEKHDPDATMLGAAQWSWLEDQLRQPADLRFLISSIQVVADGHRWEAWRNLPRERERLYGLLEATGSAPLVILSGDRHSAAFYRLDGRLPHPLWEVTSSPLNTPIWRLLSLTKHEPGPHRLGVPYYDSNFGTIDIDWATRTLRIRIHDEDGGIVSGQEIDLRNLSPESDERR